MTSSINSNNFNFFNKINSRVLQYFGCALFLLMLIAPFEFNIVKIILIFFIVGTSIAKMLILKRVGLVKPVFFWFITFIGFGIFFSIWAFLIPSNNPTFIVRSMPVNIVWPILYCFAMTHITSYKVIASLNKIMILSSILISIYLISAALSYMGILPISPAFFSLAKPVIGKYDASVQLFLPSTTSLLFLIPFLMSYLLLQIFKHDKIKSIYVILALILGIAAIVITARRALMLNLLISPLLIYAFLSLSKVTLVKKVKAGLFKLFLYFLAVATIGCTILIKYEILNIDPFIELFINGFDFSKNSIDEGSIARAEQSVGLFKSWFDYPIFGSGLGSSSLYVNRSENTPWVYELSYLTLLFQTGAIGFIMYMSLLIWIFYAGISLIKIDNRFIFLIPSLVGCFCFLLGNASNPYIIAFDHMWTIFLPVGFINYCFYNSEPKY